MNAFFAEKTETYAIQGFGYLEPSRVWNVDTFTYQQRDQLYINRSRNVHREEISNAAKDQFKMNKPPLAALHWDGKLMKDFVNQEHETLAILISGSPDYKEGKIIGNYWFYKFKLF